MVTEKVIITNALGLHLRPAGEVANEALAYNCKIELLCHGRKANAKSLLSILSLGVRKGDELGICCDGQDEAQALDCLVKVIKEMDVNLQ